MRDRMKSAKSKFFYSPNFLKTINKALILSLFIFLLNFSTPSNSFAGVKAALSNAKQRMEEVIENAPEYYAKKKESLKKKVSILTNKATRPSKYMKKYHEQEVEKLENKIKQKQTTIIANHGTKRTNTDGKTVFVDENGRADQELMNLENELKNRKDKLAKVEYKRKENQEVINHLKGVPDSEITEMKPRTPQHAEEQELSSHSQQLALPKKPEPEEQELSGHSEFVPIEQRTKSLQSLKDKMKRQSSREQDMIMAPKKQELPERSGQEVRQRKGFRVKED